MGQILNKTPILNSCLLLAVALFTSRPCLADEAPSPGPELKARQNLQDKIQRAKSQGIGIASYQNALAEIERKVAIGATESEIQTQVESIDRAISDQINRAKFLKSQRPITNGNSSSSTQPTPIRTSRSLQIEVNRLHAEMMADPETVKRLQENSANATLIVMQKIVNDQQTMKAVMRDAFNRARQNSADK